MKYNYKTKGTCSTNIEFTVEDDKIYNVKYTNGCNGNLQGISRLVEGKEIDEVISKLKGIKCGFRQTSCPDQLAKALEEVKENCKN